MKIRTALPVSLLSLTLCAVFAAAAVERYKDEALFLARLAQLGHSTLREDFEGTEWEGVRSDYPIQNFAPSITSQTLRWESAGQTFWPVPGKSAEVSTNQNWGRGGSWGIFDNYLASTLRITAPKTLYGIGFWVNTNPDGEDVGIVFEDRATANDPGYLMPGFGAMYPGDIHPLGHAFVGFIDPDGFTGVIVTGTLEINEEGTLEGGTVYGADDFTFGVADDFFPTALEVWRSQHFRPAELADPASEATLWGTFADADHDGLSNDAECALGTDPRDPSDADGGLVLDTQGGLLTLAFLRRNDDPALTVTPELSNDLLLWNSGSGFFETLNEEDQGNGYDALLVRQMPTTTTPMPARAFTRLAIERAGP